MNSNKIEQKNYVFNIRFCNFTNHIMFFLPQKYIIPQIYNLITKFAFN